MADSKLTALTSVSSLAVADLLYTSQGGTSKKATAQNMLDLMEATANIFTADQRFDGDVTIGGAPVLASQYEQIIPASSAVYAHWGNGTSGVFLSDPSAGAGLYNVLSFKTENTSAGAQAIIEIATINSATEDSGTTAIGEYRAYRDISTPAAIVTRPLYQWKNATTAKMTLSAMGSLTLNGSNSGGLVSNAFLNTDTSAGSVAVVYFGEDGEGGSNNGYVAHYTNTGITTLGNNGSGGITIESKDSITNKIDVNNTGTGSTWNVTRDNTTTLATIKENGDFDIPLANGFNLGGSNAVGNVGLEIGNSGSSGGIAYMDYHFGVSGSEDYNVRLQNNASGKFNMVPKTFAGSVLDVDFEELQLPASSTLSVGGADILSDSAGTMTLSNIDALDATTEATIAAAAGGHLTLVETFTFTASSTIQTTASIPGGSTAKFYKILFEYQNDYAGANTVRLRLNGNSTASDYFRGTITNTSTTLSTGSANNMTVASVTAQNDAMAGEVLVGAQEGVGNRVGLRATIASDDFNGTNTMLFSGTAGIGASTNYVDTISIYADQNITGTFSIYQLS